MGTKPGGLRPPLGNPKVGDQIYGFMFSHRQGGGPPGFTGDGVNDTSFNVKRIAQTKRKRIFLKR